MFYDFIYLAKGFRMRPKVRSTLNNLFVIRSFQDFWLCSVHIMHTFQTLFLAQHQLYTALHCLWHFHYKSGVSYKPIFKVIYFISISRWREGYTSWKSVILSANQILLIISIPLWDSIKFIQHLYHHTMHIWQKSKGLSVRILRVMSHCNFKKLRVRWLYYIWY